MTDPLSVPATVSTQGSADDTGPHQPHARELELARFREYRATGQRDVRDALVADAQGIAVGLARRFRDRGAEFDDLVQVAQIGLLKAIEAFDPDRGSAFISFATPTVLGELRRHFRTVWSVRMPRGLQELSQRLGPSVADLHQELGRSPSVDEVAARVGLSREQVLEAMEAGAAFRTTSLDSSLEDVRSQRPMQLRDQNADLEYERVDAQRTVESLLPTLSPRSRKIVELRFYENRSQTEIAEMIGISQMHVSRLLRQAVDQLRSAIDDIPPGGDPSGAVDRTGTE